MSSPTSRSTSRVTEDPSNLNAQFCLNTTALRDFLRLSRATVDDSILQHLNALIHPASGGFKSTNLPGPRSRQNVPDSACSRFKYQVLFPSWRARDNVLSYCSQVAETLEQSTAVEEDVQAGSAATNMPQRSEPRMNRNYWGQPMIVDERTDPYSGRDYSYARETRTQTLRSVLSNERGVEQIVRRRTWRVLSERCEGGATDGTDMTANVVGENDWQSEYRAACR